MSNQTDFAGPVSMLIGCYLPFIIAYYRGHKSKAMIFVMTTLSFAFLVIGALFGWVIMLFAPITWFVGFFISFSGNTTGNDRRLAAMIAQARAQADQSPR
jgi:hypothetical protein